MMEFWNKKILAGMATGALLITGSLAISHAQSADTADDSCGRYERRGHFGHHQMPQMDKTKLAEHMAQEFGVGKDEVLTALEAKNDFRDVGHAAMLSKVSGKSFSDVLALKTEQNGWPEVEKSLGITPEQIKESMDSLMAKRLAERANISEDRASQLLTAGYEPHDIAMAGAIAQAAGKDIQAVLDKKKINNRWPEVAKSFGVDFKDLPGDKLKGPKGSKGYDFPDGPNRAE